MTGDLVKNLKRAGEQVLGAKPLTGNDHVRLSALLKVAALELEALCAARDDATELRAACEAAKSALTALDRVQMYGSADMVRDRAKRALDLIDAALSATEGSE